MNINDIHSIAKLFGEPTIEGDNSYSWAINQESPNRVVYLRLFTGIEVQGKTEKATLVSIISASGYYELHNCSKVIIFEPDEVIFLSKSDNRISSLTVRPTGSVSVFSNIDTDIMLQNIAELDPALVMAFTQLAIFDAE